MGMARGKIFYIQWLKVKMFGKDVASFRDLAGFGKEAQDPQTSVEKLGISEATGGTAVQTSLLRSDRHKLQQGRGLTEQLGGSKTTPSP